MNTNIHFRFFNSFSIHFGIYIYLCTFLECRRDLLLFVSSFSRFSNLCTVRFFRHDLLSSHKWNLLEKLPTTDYWRFELSHKIELAPRSFWLPQKNELCTYSQSWRTHSVRSAAFWSTGDEWHHFIWHSSTESDHLQIDPTRHQWQVEFVMARWTLFEQSCVWN